MTRCGESCGASEAMHSGRDRDRDGATTRGELDVPALLAVLAQDAAMVIARPGSGEGSKMADLLSSHGYEL
jgi:hypothetical protein